MKALRIEKMQELAENRHRQLALEAEMKIAEAKAYGEKKAELEVQTLQKQVELDSLFQQKQLEMKMKKEESERLITEKKELVRIELEKAEQLASAKLVEALAKRVKLENKKPVPKLSPKEKLAILKQAVAHRS